MCCQYGRRLSHNEDAFEQRQKLTPTIAKQRVSCFGANSLWILDVFPRQLRKGVPINCNAALLCPKHVLLAVARVPNPIDEKVGDVKKTKGVAVPTVFGRVVVRKVNDTVAVTQGHTRHVPEDEHESQFFVVHVP